MIGASKLNARAARVPTTALTVTAPYCTDSELGTASSQLTVVPDVHPTVLQSSLPESSAAVGVGEKEPKFSPEIVTTVPADAAAFASTE